VVVPDNRRDLTMGLKNQAQLKPRRLEGRLYIIRMTNLSTIKEVIND